MSKIKVPFACGRKFKLEIGNIVEIINSRGSHIEKGTLCIVRYVNKPDEDDDVFIGIVFFDTIHVRHSFTPVYNWRLNAI